MSSSPIARDAAEGLAEARHPWCQPGDDPVRRFMVWFEDQEQGVATFDNEPKAREYYERATLAWNCYLLAALPREPALTADPGHVPMPRNADEAKAMWLIGERWIRDNAPEMIRSAGTEGGETQGAIPDGHLCPTGETFAEEEVRDHLRAEVSDAGGVDAWAAASYVSRYGAADFLAGGPLVSHRLMNAIGFEPVTVYRPITEAGRRVLHARTSDGGEGA